MRFTSGAATMSRATSCQGRCGSFGLSLRLVSRTPPCLATKAPALARNIALCFTEASTSVALWFVRGFQECLPKQVPSPAPLMGFFKDRPSVDIGPVSPLPVARSSRLPHLSHVPLLPFLPASAVSSSRVCAGLLHPAADHGVRPVSGREPTSTAEAMGCREPDRPHGRHTLRSISLCTTRNGVTAPLLTRPPPPFPSRC
jgi:hypothetical protein